MSDARHHVGRLVFELEAPDRKTLTAWETTLYRQFDHMLPALQRALDQAECAGETLRFDRVEVDLGRFDPDAIATELGPRLATRLAQALSGQLPSSEAVSVELSGFLESGELPWIEASQALDWLCAQLLGRDDASLRSLALELRPTLVRRTAAERLAHQLPAALVERLLRALLPDELAATVPASRRDSASPLHLPQAQAAEVAVVIGQLARAMPLPTADEVSRALAALQGRIPPGPPPALQGTPLPSQATALQGPITPGAPSTPRSKLLRSQGAAQPAIPAAAVDNEAISPGVRPVPAAGAVLLHPFLAHFFERLELTVERGRFRDHDAHCRAVLLTHHLATGAAAAPEPETVLPKLLCGFPLSAPLPRCTELPDEVAAEVDTLLRSVLGQWQGLGRTSPAGLREGFLLRPGRLQARDGQGPAAWQLWVETRSIDVLLERLPWTLSHVRTPFMKSILRVDWR